MAAIASPPEPTGLARIFAWRRVRPVLIACLLVSLLLLTTWLTSYVSMLGRLLFIGMSGVFVFGVLERWPRKLPRWLARWVLQVVGVAITMPIATLIGYNIATMHDVVPWYRDQQRLTGFGIMTFWGMLLGPWMAMSALYRQVSGQVQRQALAFELERSEFERNAIHARMRLLQAQIQPHFLFNTLANVRELVESGSPQAPVVLSNLIAYLRAAVPRLDDAATTLAQELELVRAYLEVMHMRMPDRLQFTLQADEDSARIFCPPMSLLTLVENAVRHGIDPSEEGGRIEVRVRVRDGRCRAEVIDTGVGIDPAHSGPGTGLSNLRERLKLAFGGDAQVRLSRIEPRGTIAEIEFPRADGAGMIGRRPSALIADDEPLLRKALVRMLAKAWPELVVVAQARNGREAVEQFEALQPDVCFLDVHMPGLSGVEAARFIGRRAHLVFVTAFDQYAVQAFAQGAIDYLVKPVEPARLADTVARLQQRLVAAQPAGDTDTLLEQIAERLRKGTAPAGLRWLRVSVGQSLKLVAVDEIDFLRSDEKYTLVAWRGEGGKANEGLIRTPLKELVPQLDAEHFTQVHRSAVVNLRAISHVTRGDNETADIHMKGRADVLPVSRSYLHLFKQM